MNLHIASDPQSVRENGQRRVPVTCRWKHAGVGNPEVIDGAQTAARIAWIVDR
jgi:hypothetical protein